MTSIFSPEDQKLMQEATDALGVVGLDIEERLTSIIDGRQVLAGYCPDCRMPVTINGAHLCHSGLHFEF